MGRIKDISFQSIIIILSICFFLGCERFPITFSAKKAINLVMLVDCSSSLAADTALLEKSIMEAGKWWADQVVKRNGGKCEILIIGSGIDDIFTLYSQKRPETFPIPAGYTKKIWKNDFEKELHDVIKNLPVDKGSAIIEGILRANNRLKEYDGDKFLVIYSDMRQFTSGIWNFEREIPKPMAFKEWIEKHYLTPSFDRDIQVTICGFKPYFAIGNTAKITPTDYGKLHGLWLFLFEGWGKKVILTEEFNPKNLVGGDRNGYSFFGWCK